MKDIYMSVRFLALALLAAALLGCASTPTQESTGEYFDDTTITAKVKTALLADKDVSGLAINVETFKGAVQLSGFAGTEAERLKAAELTRNVKGVKSVKNDIRLK
jgi:hyperosmotically inducible periplasmic protein